MKSCFVMTRQDLFPSPRGDKLQFDFLIEFCVEHVSVPSRG